MTAERREGEEGARRGLVQKMESWLRAHFDGRSAGIGDGSIEELLLQVGADWLLNRGLPADSSEVAEAAREALARYRSNWKGKEQGADDRSHNFGRTLGASVKKYSAGP